MTLDLANRLQRLCAELGELEVQARDVGARAKQIADSVEAKHAEIAATRRLVALVQSSPESPAEE